MAKTLSDFIRERADEYTAEAAKNEKLISEWQSAVTHLIAKLQAWLDESDPARVIRTNQGLVTIHEPGLGRYEAARLDIQAFGTWIGVLPVARLTGRAIQCAGSDQPTRAAGRVDMTDNSRRYYLYRTLGARGDEWFIEGPPDDEPRPLTREAFETAVLSYL